MAQRDKKHAEHNCRLIAVVKIEMRRHEMLLLTSRVKMLCVTSCTVQMQRLAWKSLHLLAPASVK